MVTINKLLGITIAEKQTPDISPNETKSESSISLTRSRPQPRYFTWDPQMVKFLLKNEPKQYATQKETLEKLLEKQNKCIEPK